MRNSVAAAKPRNGAGRLATDELGFKNDGIWECIFGSLQAFQKSLRASLSHQAKRLCDGRESWNLEGCARDVVEANHGNIAGTLETDVCERSQRSYRC